MDWELDEKEGKEGLSSDEKVGRATDGHLSMLAWFNSVLELNNGLLWGFEQ